MLTIVPDEIESADISRSLHNELTDQIHTYSIQFAQIVDTMTIQAMQSKELFLALLKQITAYLHYGMTLTMLFTEHQPTYHFVVTGLQTSDVEIITQSLVLIRKLLEQKEYPRTTTHIQALSLLLDTMNHSVQSILCSVYNNNYTHTTEYRVDHLYNNQLQVEVDLDTDIGILCMEYTNTYAHLADTTCESDLLCTGYKDPSTEVRETGLITSFYSGLLGLIHLKPRKFIISTFDFWIEYQDTGINDWHPYLRSTVIYEFFLIIINHLLYTKQIILSNNNNEKEINEEYEDFVSFRDTRMGITDVVVLCMSTLKSQYFNILHSKLQLYKQNNILEWWHLEVILYTLTISMSAIKDIVMKVNYFDPSYQKAIVQFLYDVTECVFALPESVYVSEKNGFLYTSICQYLGSLTFLLTSSMNHREVMQLCSSTSSGGSQGEAGSVVYITEFYYQALRRAIAAVSSNVTQTATEAAKAVHKLVVHGSAKLIASIDNPSSEATQTLLYLVQYTSSYIQNPAIPTSTVMILVESTTRCIMQIGVSEVQIQLLNAIGEGILTSLQTELQKPMSVLDDQRVVGLLSYASQLIRFSDVPTSTAAAGSTTTTHPLLSFLTAFWPVLQAIGSDNRVSQSPNVTNAIYEIFGKVLMSVGSAIFSEVPNITAAVLASVSYRNGSVGAALGCVSIMIECLCRVPMEGEQTSVDASVYTQGRQYMLQLITSITDQYVMCPEYHNLLSQAASPDSTSQCLSLFGTAYDAMEQYFSVIHTYLVFCRSDFVSNSTVLQLPQKVLGLATVCLTHCVEKEPLRAILHTLQILFVPANSSNTNHTQESNSDVSVGQSPILAAVMEYGARIVQQLFQLLSEARIASALVPNITETIYCLIIACEVSNTSNSTGSSTASVLQSQCSQWIEAAVMSPTLFLPLTELHQRQVLLHGILSLAASRSRRFKSLIQDVYKICCSELTVDTIMVYAE